MQIFFLCQKWWIVYIFVFRLKNEKNGKYVSELKAFIGGYMPEGEFPQAYNKFRT